MPFAVGFILVGLVLLTAGADRLVVAAAKLSKAFGVSPILIGALVIGLGTSAPELLVSGLASARGELSLAVGNIVGSNVANLSLVLGATALVAVLFARLEVLQREGVLMMAAVLGFASAVWDGRLERWEGVILLAGMGLAIVLVVHWRGSDAAERLRAEEEVSDMTGSGEFTFLEGVLGLAGLAGTLLGAELLVRGATRLAEELDLSATVVGLTIVAIGTSLPELATALQSARHRQGDLVIGNLLGSNLFNSLAVAGVAAVVGPGVILGSFRFSVVMMVAIAAAAGVLVATGRRLTRLEGAFLLGGFVIFLIGAL